MGTAAERDDTDASAGAYASAGLRPGERVDRYVLERRVGAGGAGTVFAARDERTGARVALKVLRRDAAEDGASAARFEREARAIRAVGHPHIVDVLDVGRVADGRPYLVMPLLRGRTLRDELRARGGRLARDEAWAILRPLGEALAAAHAVGVVHRDVKPENVWLERRAEHAVPRLLDFGLAKLTTPGASAGPKLTDTGAPVGTPGYMSPEQWWNQAVGPATDQYALGVMAFELLAGRLPFESERYVELLQQHLSAPPPTLAAMGIDADPALEAWLARTLAKDPAARFDAMDTALGAGDAAFGWDAARARLAWRDDASDREVPASQDEPGAVAAGEGASSGEPAAPSSAETASGGLLAPDAPDARDAPVAPVASRTRLPRAVPVALALAGVPALLAAGYAGSHNGADLFRLAGWGIFPTVITFALAVAWLATGRGLSRWAVFLPGLLGTFGTYTGWLAVLRALERLPTAQHFEVLNDGVSEADVNRYVGFVLAGTLALAALAARAGVGGPQGDDRASSRARREALAAAGGLGVLTLAALALGAPSAALAAGAAACGAFTLRGEPRDGARALARAADLLAVVILVAGGALTRVEGRAAALWAAAPSRAARASEVVAAAQERTATQALVGAAALVALALALTRLSRARRAGGIPRPARGAWILGAVLALWAALDVGLHARIRSRGEAVWRTFGPQFALFAQLDPPSAAGLGAPHVAPALQLARDVVAVDSVRVALIASLDTVAGRSALALDLSHHLAREGAPAGPRDAQLLVMADRSHAWRTVASALAVARDVGARRAEVLLTRGPAPVQRPSDPPEAAYALPRDFGAVAVELAAASDDGAVGYAPDVPFARVAEDLTRRARAGESVRLRVESAR